MNELSRLATELGDFCAKRGWRFCIIGGFAVQYWGEPRMTMDVDLSLLTGFGEEEGFVDELLRHYAGRLPETRNFALQNRVLLLKHSSGVGIFKQLQNSGRESTLCLFGFVFSVLGVIGG